MNKTVLVLICTGEDYWKYLPQAVEGARKYFPADILLFTDSPADYGVTKQVYLRHQGWPDVTLMRYHTMLSQREFISQYKHIYYLDVDMQIVRPITDEILADGIVVTTHPSYVEETSGTPETDRRSTACLQASEVKQYVAGGFQGGSVRSFLKMAETISKNIDKDKEIDFIARWHDESHLNRYVVDNPPAKLLSKDYVCRPRDQNEKTNIITITKNRPDRPSVNKPLPPIQTLWIGNKLSSMETLSLASFLHQGHEVHLYTYGQVSGVPSDVQIKDANEVMPLSHWDYNKFPNLATFADFFRYKLLWERGGWWSDTDAVCVRPFAFPHEYVFSSENVSSDCGKTLDGIHINNGTICVPAGSPIMEYCWNTCKEMDLQKIPWGTSGPALIQKAVNKFGLQKYVQAPEVFCPVDGWDVEKLINSSETLNIPKNARAIHLWNTMWPVRKMNKDEFPVGSPYDQLRNDIGYVKPYLGDVTAVIKTLLRDKSLFRCVQTLKDNYPSMHIIVVDDGKCSKEKGDKLKAMGVDKYIELPWNRGLSAGRNALLDACETPYMLLCDDDFTFTKDSHVERLRQLMDVADIAAGLVYNAKAYTFSAGESGKGWDTFGGNFYFHEGKLYLKDFSGAIQKHRNIRYEQADLVLNFFVGKVKALKHVRWDETIGQAYEHQDFFLRAKDLGLVSVRSLDAQVIHKELDDTGNSEYMRIRADYEKYHKVFQEKWGFPCLEPWEPENIKQIEVPSPVVAKRSSAPKETFRNKADADEFESIMQEVQL
jgi:GT2 family glycosyltransferase